MMPSTSTRKSSENKLDEMTKLIKNMYEKINRLEMENKNQNRPMKEGYRNTNQFRCSFVPRYLHRGGIMIFKEKKEIMRIRGFNFLFKII